MVCTLAKSANLLVMSSRPFGVLRLAPTDRDHPWPRSEWWASTARPTSIASRMATAPYLSNSPQLLAPDTGYSIGTKQPRAKPEDLT